MVRGDPMPSVRHHAVLGTLGLVALLTIVSTSFAADATVRLDTFAEWWQGYRDTPDPKSGLLGVNPKYKPPSSRWCGCGRHGGWIRTDYRHPRRRPFESVELRTESNRKGAENYMKRVWQDGILPAYGYSYLGVGAAAGLAL